MRETRYDEDTVEIYGELVKETSEAYGIKVEEDSFGKEAEIFWLPKSRTIKNDDGSYTIPEWLATEKGLV